MQPSVDFGKWTLKQLRESLATLLQVDSRDPRYARAVHLIDVVTREMITRDEVRRYLGSLRR